MDQCQVSAAPAGSRCWCGQEALVVRENDRVTSRYCASHWALWWQRALQIAGITLSA